MKKILITGKNSYVGKSLEKWLESHPDKYSVETISLRDNLWKEKNFSNYDVIFHVAAMVHKKEKPELKELYYEVNRDLPVEVAKKGKLAGVRHFIFMSTMAVYGEEGKVNQEIVITRETKPNPKTFYGRSKLDAENELQKLNNENFNVLILRPPMIYGPNCPGNYSKLERLALKTPVFPLVENKRSMLYINKLCEMVQMNIDNEDKGVFIPQDDEYVNTSLLVKKIGEQNGRKIYLSKAFGWIIKLILKNNNIINKVFGNLVYEKK
jgi:nucleoside-diphosphate-sugar epimerase